MIRRIYKNPAPSSAKPPLRVIACAIVFACAFSLLASAQTQQPAQRKHARAAKPSPAQPAEQVQPVAVPAPEVPPAPKWPANDPPAPPSVTLNSQGLHIVAENSSLSSILNQVSTETGAKVEGLSDDERVFGDYGPGSPRDVLAQLFNGANYNVLILGDFAQGEPLRVVLSPRQSTGGPSQPNARPQQPDQEEDYSEPQQEEQQPQPYQPPVINRPPNQPMRPMTPQERMQEMQERQREFQQQQQQQQPQPQ